MTSTVILLLSHVLDRGVRALFEELRRDCSARVDVWFLGDNTRRTFDGFGSDPAYRLFERSDLESLEYPGKAQLSYAGEPPAADPHRSMTAGHIVLPLLWFYKRSPSYEHYWVAEYDVRYTGSWMELVTYFDSSRADLLGTTLTRYADRPDWTWWSSMHLAGLPIVREEFIRGFFPVYRLSNRALRHLDRDYARGVRGHDESLMPTLLNHAGLYLEDIGGDGRFVRSENVNRFYRNTPSKQGLAPGTFVFRPVRHRPGKEPDTLWHPIKYRSLWRTAMDRV